MFLITIQSLLLSVENRVSGFARVCTIFMSSPVNNDQSTGRNDGGEGSGGGDRMMQVLRALQIPLPLEPRYSRVEDRLRTFADTWAVSEQTFRRFVDWGFYCLPRLEYDNTLPTIRCFFCGVLLGRADRRFLVPQVHLSNCLYYLIASPFPSIQREARSLLQLYSDRRPEELLMLTTTTDDQQQQQQQLNDGEYDAVVQEQQQQDEGSAILRLAGFVEVGSVVTLTPSSLVLLTINADRLSTTTTTRTSVSTMSNHSVSGGGGMVVDDNADAVDNRTATLRQQQQQRQQFRHNHQYFHAHNMRSSVQSYPLAYRFCEYDRGGSGGRRNRRDTRPHSNSWFSSVSAAIAPRLVRRRNALTLDRETLRRQQELLRESASLDRFMMNAIDSMLILDYVDNHQQQNGEAAVSTPPTCVNGNTLAPPKHPAYTLYQTRLETFESWPIAMPIDQYRLAAAGFFYGDRNDTVTCFHCAATYSGWRSHDDPWTVHARLRTVAEQVAAEVDQQDGSSGCAFVLTVKGEEFVSRARNTEEQPATAGAANNNDDAAADLDESQETDDKTTHQTAVKCIICCIESATMMFLPCGHLVSCYKCAIGQSKCFVCRQKIDVVHKAFFA